MNSNLKRVVLLVITTSFAALIGTGCNTSKGFGKDVEKLGDKIQDKASR